MQITPPPSVVQNDSTVNIMQHLPNFKVLYYKQFSSLAYVCKRFEMNEVIREREINVL